MLKRTGQFAEMESRSVMPGLEPWTYRQAMTGWWVCRGEWEPGHPERIVATCKNEGDAIIIVADHNSLR